MVAHRGHRGPARATQYLPAWAISVLRLIGDADALALRNLLRALKHLVAIAEERLADLVHQDGSEARREAHEAAPAPDLEGGKRHKGSNAVEATASWS